jgi:hypothetical protein
MQSGHTLGPVSAVLLHQLPSPSVSCTNADGVYCCLQTLHRMLGYERGELDGKNVTVLMPAVFSQRHASYLQRYMTTGEARILDTQREVLAVHKDHSVLPISIGIMKMSGTGNDSMFMAVIQLSPQPEDMARMWIMPTGQVSQHCCPAMQSIA